MQFPQVLVLLAGWIALLSMLIIWFAVQAIRRLRGVRRGAWIVVEVAGGVTEVTVHVPRWRRWLVRQPPPAPSVMGLRRIARVVAGDARVAGVVLRLGELSCGWATAMSLREVITSLRAAGKRVVAYLPHGGMTREVYVATAAERIYAPPQASISPLGVASGTTFYRALLARGGIDTEALARREFKSAIEPYTRDSLSEENRMQTSAILDTVHSEVVRALAAGRGMSEEQARALMDGAPYRAREAAERGLVDGVAYEDELPSLLGEGATMVRLERYLALSVRLVARALQARRGKRVGLVEVKGPIVSEARVRVGRLADADRVIAALRAARANPAISAVVLYVDSRGGSALASDLIAHEIERLKEKKPVVAYFSDVSASGGYYVAALANEIVAQPLTVTGSIGVFTLRFVLRRAIEKLGLSHEVIRRGARADIMSPYRHWTDDERAALDREIEGFYTDFVGIVARGRGRRPEEIEPLARGRIYSGRDAHAQGLVDRLGGLDVAVARAADLANIPPPAEPVVVHPPREMPEPAEPPAPLQPIVSCLSAGLDLVNLALNAGNELLFAYDDAVES